jgi:hypothetical protein
MLLDRIVVSHECRGGFVRPQTAGGEEQGYGDAGQCYDGGGQDGAVGFA